MYIVYRKFVPPYFSRLIVTYSNDLNNLIIIRYLIFIGRIIERMQRRDKEIKSCNREARRKNTCVGIGSRSSNERGRTERKIGFSGWQRNARF